MSLFPLTKRALSSNLSVTGSSEDCRCAGAYAALFCAFLLDCAGVKDSFSSLLLLLPVGPSSMSSPNPLSVDPFGSRDSCCAGGDADVGSGVRPEPVPKDASKEV